jgi:galactonate dehydratase
MPNLIAARRARLLSAIPMQAQAASNDPLAVADVRFFPVREPESGRKYTVVRVSTRNGLQGYGEAAGAVRTHWDETRQAITGLAASAYEVARVRLAATPAMSAAVNMALLDILGKQTKAPCYQVLGGPTRFKARALAPLAEGTAAGLDIARRAGYKAFAVPAPAPPFHNSGKSYVLKVTAMMNDLRSAAGPNLDFVLDGGGKLAPGDAQIVSDALEKFHLLWFDEPCRTAALGAVRKIADENVTPLGFGRNEQTAAGFQDLLREEVVDIIRPAISRFGISGIRRIATLAETCYIAVAPYHNGGPVATAAALHLAASIPNFFIQEVPRCGERDREMREAIAGAALEKVTDGFLPLPTGHGLGIRVNEQALERYKEAA